MSKLIVLEGPDNIGKTTQVAKLKELLGARQIIQPSGENLIGFLREEVKNNPEYNPFERQLLHTVSHVVDAFTAFSGDEVLIMDRCHASTYAYGKVQNIDQKKIDLLMEIHSKVYDFCLDDHEVHIIFLDRDSRFDSNLTDNFEKTINWNELRTQYLKLASLLRFEGLTLFQSDESVNIVDVGDKSPDKVTQELLEIING